MSDRSRRATMMLVAATLALAGCDLFGSGDEEAPASPDAPTEQTLEEQIGQLAANVVGGEINPELAPPECSAECPEGTQLASFDFGDEIALYDALNSGAFYIESSEGCESLCTPVVRCLAPYVPVVTAAGFDCQLLSGWADRIAPAAELDLSWGAAWDPVATIPAPEEER